MDPYFEGRMTTPVEFSQYETMKKWVLKNYVYQSIPHTYIYRLLWKHCVFFNPLQPLLVYISLHEFFKFQRH